MKKVRASGPPPVEDLIFSQKISATLLTGEHGLVDVQLGQAVSVHPGQRIRYANVELQVIHEQDLLVHRMQLDAEAHIPTHGTVEFMEHIMLPSQVERQLHMFWDQFWNRDSLEDLNEQGGWEDFDSFRGKVDPVPLYKLTRLILPDSSVQSKPPRHLLPGE